MLVLANPQNTIANKETIERNTNNLLCKLLSADFTCDSLDIGQTFKAYGLTVMFSSIISKYNNFLSASLGKNYSLQKGSVLKEKNLRT